MSIVSRYDGETVSALNVPDPEGLVVAATYNDVVVRRMIRHKVDPISMPRQSLIVLVETVLLVKG